jgi:leucyl aminopeptidase
MKPDLTLDLAPIVPSLTLKSGNPLTAPVNAVVVGLTSDNKVSIYADSIPKAAATKIVAALVAVGATGKKDEVTRIPAGSLATADVIVAIGLGNE